MSNDTSLTPSLHGTWRLLSFVVEEQSSGRQRPAFERPGFETGVKGRLIILPNGTMMTVLTADRRPSPTSAEDRVNGFNTMVAYSGRYTVQGEQFITKVDVAWNEEWADTVQVRYIKFIGARLQLLSAWAPNPFDPKKTVRGILEWERESAA